MFDHRVNGAGYKYMEIKQSEKFNFKFRSLCKFSLTFVLDENILCDIMNISMIYPCQEHITRFFLCVLNHVVIRYSFE